MNSSIQYKRLISFTKDEANLQKTPIKFHELYNRKVAVNSVKKKKRKVAVNMKIKL